MTACSQTIPTEKPIQIDTILFNLYWNFEASKSVLFWSMWSRWCLLKGNHQLCRIETYQRKLKPTKKMAHCKKAKGIQSVLMNYGALIWPHSFFSVVWRVSCSNALEYVGVPETPSMWCVEPTPRFLRSQLLRSTNRIHSRQWIWLHLILPYSGEWFPCSGIQALLDMIFKI